MKADRDLKKAVVLSDGKPGHLNQSLGIAEQLKNTEVEVIEIEYKAKWVDLLTRLSGVINNFLRFNVKLAEQILKLALPEQKYKEIIAVEADLILSAGSSVAALNLILSKVKQAKAIVCMTPSLIGTRSFDLAIVPKHDQPPKRKNIIQTYGAPNRITSDFINQEVRRWNEIKKVNLTELKSPLIGLMVGGSNSYFDITVETISLLLDQIMDFIATKNGEIILTTSRRTPKAVEQVLKERLANHNRCRLLIIADEWGINPVPMMLGVSDLVVVTEDSVSMVSEAVSGNSRVLVAGLNKKKNNLPRSHQTLQSLEEQNYIKYCELANLRAGQLTELMKQVYLSDGEERLLQDTYVAAREIEKRFY
ncbi:mitochondrial fission ELM1 family protein [Natroniella sulfidigena]|uniref:mitochondrial fission ELM1 family protein n=1 Tax=Natroniella sulfidigena TaxID=723921 RepID=UPI00200A5912|nr:ELM1/GtrOC1 family putative glycosyltransferase [Natroniella sulfidigena]MCK8816320.1 mitochondrial fission ELM1 family protein [Natroniella sulfidigena]